MSTVPIPQGATIADPSAPPPNGGGVAIPHGATLGDPIPAGASIGNAAAPAAPAAPAEEPSLADKINAMWNVMGSIDPDKIADRGTRELMQQLRGAMGVLKGAGQTVTTVSKAMHSPTAMRAALLANPVTAGLGATLSDDHLGHIAETLAPSSGIERMEKGSELHGLEEHVGAAGEMILEYMMGDEALKTLSIAQRMKKLAPVMQILEEHPRLAMATLAGIKNAALGGGQALLHGADAKDAAITGAITGVTAGAGEAAGGAITDAIGRGQAAAASEREGAAALANTATEQGAAAEGARATADSAAQDLRAAQEGVATARQQAPQTISDLANRAGNSYKAGAEGSWIRQNAGESVADFEQAAELAQKEAKPLFAKVDAASNGRYSELRDTLNKAWKARDMAKVDETEHALDELFHMDFGKGMVSEPDALAAREAWRTSKTLEGLHRVVEQSFTGPSRELAERTGVARSFVGGQGLQTRFRNFIGKVGLDEVERVVGPDGVDNIVKLAEATSAPKDAMRAAQVTEAIAKEMERVAAKSGKQATAAANKALGAPPSTPIERILKYAARKTAAGTLGGMAGAAAGGPVGAKAGTFAGMAADESSRMVWRAAMTNPRVGRLVTMAIKTGASPKIYAPLVVQAMQDEQPTPSGPAAAER